MRLTACCLIKVRTFLYLSHDVSGLDSLEQVYILIWSFVHSNGLVGTTEDEDLVHAMMLDAIFGILRKDDIQKAWKARCTLSSGQLEYLWKSLIDRNLIDETGKVLANEDFIDGLTQIACPVGLSSEQLNVVGTCIKNALKVASSTCTDMTKDDIQKAWLDIQLLTEKQLDLLRQDLSLQRVIDEDGIILCQKMIMRDTRIIRCPQYVF